MPELPDPAALRQNRLLASLDPRSRDRLRPLLSLETFLARHVVHEAGEALDRVYFPISGMISLVTVLSDGTGVEAAIVGPEGMLGEEIFLGDTHWANVRAVVQIEAQVLALSTRELPALVEHTPGLEDALALYTRARMVAAAQDVACNRRHALEQRAAKWLLMTQERAGTDAFPITHEFLAQMIGAQRPSVTEAVARLQSLEAITYRRGWVHVTGQETLEKAACECFGVIRDEFARILPPPFPDPSGG